MTIANTQKAHIATILRVTTTLQEAGEAVAHLGRQRAHAIAFLRRDGLSYNEIAAATGLSKARVAQIARSPTAQDSDTTRCHHATFTPVWLYRIDLYTTTRGSLMTDHPSTPTGTAFDLTGLDQQTYWTDEHGTAHPIEDLDQDSCTQLAAWLLDHARHFYLQALPHTLLTQAIREQAVDDMVFLDARTWMRSTPLHQALVARQDLIRRIGPVCSGTRAAERLGLSNANDLRHLATLGEVLVITTTDGYLLCPLWQFTKSADGKHWGTRLAVRAMLIHLTDVDPWAVAALFNIPAPELHGRTPRDVIRDGRPPLVELETLARHFAAEHRN